MKKMTTTEITYAGIIAAIYVALTLLMYEISFSNAQIRISEMLTILPIFTPAAIPGLFVGCLISNIAGGVSMIDIIVGPILTLIAALLTRKLRRKPMLAAIPPILVNAFGVGAILYWAYDLPYWSMVLSIGVGQTIACYGLGTVLIYAMRKLPFNMFADGIQG